MPGVEVGRLQGEGLEALVQWREVVDVDGRHADQRAQFPQGRILLVARLDFLGGGQFVT
ncbi:hypothetical protein D3C84_1244380 [compost metagenome]